MQVLIFFLLIIAKSSTYISPSTIADGKSRCAAVIVLRYGRGRTRSPRVWVCRRDARGRRVWQQAFTLFLDHRQQTQRVQRHGVLVAERASRDRITTIRTRDAFRSRSRRDSRLFEGGIQKGLRLKAQAVHLLCSKIADEYSLQQQFSLWRFVRRLEECEECGKGS